MSGLIHPVDLDAWSTWSRRRHKVRGLRTVFQTVAAVPEDRWVYRNASTNVEVLIAASTGSPSARAALLAPANYLHRSSVAVVSEVRLSSALPGWTESRSPWRLLMNDVTAVLGDGNFLQHGHDVWQEAVTRKVPYFVSQHGALTPHAPPLPPGSTHLAWTDQDGEFWRSGREDVRFETVGSQLMWEAGKQALEVNAGSLSPTEGGLVYLGQGHAAELPRMDLARAALAFCRATEATYRPHPSERDRISRLAHKGYQRVGINVDSSVPLNELAGPVVSVFSTGVLEAAAQGRDAWVAFPRPPAWLGEFWERYSMNRFGGRPTSAPARSAVAPAERIARIVQAAS